MVKFLVLEIVDFLQGLFSLLFVLISLILGFTILSKYFKYRSKLYVLVGLSWIGVANPWFPDSISFIMNLFFQKSLQVELYFIIGNAFIPLALLTWLIAYTNMLGKKRQKLIISLTLIFSIAFEIVFFYLLTTNIDLIGTINPSRPFTVDFDIFITIYLLVVIAVMLITGIKFAQKSVKSAEKDIRLKGKLLRAAFITFTIAAIFDSLLGAIFPDPTDPILAIMVVATRILLIISAFEFYGGFILPRWMHSLFTKK
jgi:hypothetical protein